MSRRGDGEAALLPPRLPAPGWGPDLGFPSRVLFLESQGFGLPHVRGGVSRESVSRVSGGVAQGPG